MSIEILVSAAAATLTTAAFVPQALHIIRYKETRASRSSCTWPLRSASRCGSSSAADRQLADHVSQRRHARAGARHRRHEAEISVSTLTISLSHSSSLSTFDPERPRLFQLRAGARARHHVVGVLGHRAGHLGAEPLGARLRLGARHALERAGEHHGLAGDRRGVIDRLERLRPHLAAAARRPPRHCAARRRNPRSPRPRSGRCPRYCRARRRLRLRRSAAGRKHRVAKRARCRHSSARAASPWSRRHGECRAHR